MKQTGQLKIIKNGSSVNFEHQVTFIFTKQDKTNFTRSTNEKGTWDFDVPNGEYFISAFLTQSEEKKTEQFRGGLLFVVNAQTKVTALDDWINGGAIEAKDPMQDWWENLLNETQKAAQDAETARDEIVNGGYYSPANTRKDKNNVLHSTTGAVRDTLLVGDLGLGGYQSTNNTSKLNEMSSGFDFFGDASSANSPFSRAGVILKLGGHNNLQAQLHFGNNNIVKYRFGNKAEGWGSIKTFLTTENTIVDSNGFIKKASPIIKLFDDHIEWNQDFKEDPIFEKIAPGTYKISNTHGLAREGWTYEKPRGKDGNTYFKIKVQKLDDGCIISVHDYFVDYEDITIIDDAGNRRTVKKPIEVLSQARDIKPEERWIDLRFFEKIYDLTNELPKINIPYHPLWGIEPYIPPVVGQIEEDTALENQRAF